MSEINWHSIDLGPIDAYAEAVEAGYTGTREEWLLEVGSVKENAEAAATAAEGAAGSATSAAASAAEAAQYTSTAVHTWLENNIDPDSGYALDRTLSEPLEAAPADMVGDLKTAIELIPVSVLDDVSTTSAGTYYGKLISATGEKVSVYKIDQYSEVVVKRPTSSSVYFLISDTLYTTSDVPTDNIPCVNRNGKSYTYTNPNHRKYLYIRSKAANDSTYSASVSINIPKQLDVVIENTKDFAEIPKIELSMTDTLRFSSWRGGYMVEDGTIYSPTTANKIKKYDLRDGVDKIYITGTSTMSVANPKYCVLWFVKNGAMMTGGNVPITSNPQTWTNYEVTVPTGAEEVWLYLEMTITTETEYQYDIGERIRAINEDNISEIKRLELSMVDTLHFSAFRGGYMEADGTIYSPTTANKIKKYDLREGVDKVYITGTSTMSVANPAYCVLWFVKNGAMMTGGYVAVTSNPQTWTDYEVSVPTGAEQVWLYANMTIATETEYKYDIGERIRSLDIAQYIPGFFDGAFPWTKRVFGLRMLADAQGCYFIPFNALGLGVNRGNGIYGNSYVLDQIHPTQLGAYNTALGIWSYLKNIPCWHTAMPGSVVQPIDGTQWSGKTWYAYGTSLTEGTTTTNKYADFVATMSGMTLVNKGKGGGALVTNRQIYDRLLDMTDGKLNADLITIEVGANDRGDLGNPWSLDTNTFYGALNHCIHEMFDGGIQAQVVIMASYGSRYNVYDSSEKYDVDRMLNT